MQVLAAIVFLVGGFALLLAGGEFLVRSSVSIASRLRISPAVIGATIIAGGTSAPEMITSAFAALRDLPDIAVGNVVGSNIFNLLAVVGLSALLKPNKIDSHTLKFDYPILVFATALFLVAGWDGVFMRTEGSVFLVAMIIFLVLAFWTGKSENSDEIDKLKTPVHDIIYLALGFVGLAAGADLALKGGIQLGEMAGLSERVIGITIISAGTGLPELAASAVAAYRGRSDIAIANVIGSNILNTFGVVGIAASLKPLLATSTLIHNDGIILAGFTALMFVPLALPKREIGRGLGALLLASYIGYIAYLLVF